MMPHQWLLIFSLASSLAAEQRAQVSGVVRDDSQAVLQDASGLIEASWPGQPFLDRTIRKDDVLLLTGPVRFFHGRQLVPREFVNLGADETGTASGRVRCLRR